MNEELLTYYMEHVENMQFTSELETLDHISVQLLKDYYMEAGGNPIPPAPMATLNNEKSDNRERRYVQHAHRIVEDDGHVPTIHRIADWFQRVVSLIANYFSNRRITRLIERVRRSKRLHDQNVFEGIVIDEKWYKENIEEPLNLMHENYIQQLVILSNDDEAHVDDKMNEIFNNRGSDVSNNVQFHREVTIVRQRLHDSSRDLNRLTAVRDGNAAEAGPFRHVHNYHRNDDGDIEHMRNLGVANPTNRANLERINRRERGPARNLESLLDHMTESNNNIQNDLRELRRSIPAVRRRARQLINWDVNNSERHRHVSEMYVHFITDLMRSYTYITLMFIRILDWLRYTLGIDHNPTKTRET